MGLFRKKTEVRVTAVIAAAGSALRMEGVDKQMAELGEAPVIVHSIMAFNNCPAVKEIVVVCKGGQIPEFYDLVQEYELDKVTSVVRGGGTRQQSVFAGIEAAGPEAEYYAIHDGARPLVRRRDIEECIRDAVIHRAAALGAPVRDTLKRVDGDGFIKGTVDRSGLYAVYTPQIFEAGLYRAVMEQARRSGREYTDDCQLVEASGYKVYITKGSGGNIKITSPEDLDLAESLLFNMEED